MLEAAAVAVILVIAGCALLVRLAAYAPAAPIAAAIPVAAGDPGADPALMRPALVNLLLTRCAPDSAAYCATILDLAARGFLTARATAGGLWVELAHPPAAGPLAGPFAAILLAADEAAAALGPLRRTTEVPTPAGSGVIYQGPRGTLSVVTVTGGIAQFNLRLGRRHGSPLPAIGDEAWLLNRRRSVVLRAGQHVAKLTLSRRRGAWPPVPLEALAETVAGRLAARLPAEDGAADSG